MNAVAKIEPSNQLPTTIEHTSESAIDRILAKALDSDVDLDRLEQLYALKRQYDADEARKAYAADMAEFKRNAPTIIKDKHVRFQTSKGVTEYDHATIGNVVETVIASLGQFGFSHRWEPTQKEGKVHVKCICTHRLGHAETVEMFASPDDSGTKNNIQAIISTKTYLERHTLLAITGLATKDQPDNDGRTADKPELSDEELEAQRKIEATNREWISAFGKAVDSSTLSKLYADLCAACGGRDMVPATLKDEYMARKRALAPAAKQ